MNSLTKDSLTQLLKINKFLSAADTPHQFGWFMHNQFSKSDVRNTVDMSWACEYQNLRSLYLQQTMSSLRVHNRAFKCSGEKYYMLSDIILYNDYARLFYLKAKEDDDEIAPLPSIDVGRMLACFMPREVQKEYKLRTNPWTKEKGVNPVTNSYHHDSDAKPYDQALKKFAKIHAVAHPEDASSDVELRDVALGECEVLNDMILDITEWKNKFNKARVEGDTTEPWWESMNRVFRPMDDFFQGLVKRYRIFHCPEKAQLPQLAGVKRRREDADRDEDLWTATERPLMIDVVMRKGDRGQFIPDTYLYGLDAVSRSIQNQKQSMLGSQPLGNASAMPKKAAAGAKKPPTPSGAGGGLKSALKTPVAHADDVPEASADKATKKQAKKARAAEKKRLAKLAAEEAKFPHTESPPGAKALALKQAAAAAITGTAKKKAATVTFRKQDKFAHPNLQDIGTAAGKYKEAMADLISTSTAMVRTDHPNAAPPGQLCLSDLCRTEGCGFNAARFPNHAPMTKRNNQTLVNDTGECGYMHIDDDAVREQVLQKTHAIRLDIWNSLSDEVKMDPKCKIAEKEAAYKASKAGV